MFATMNSKQHFNATSAMNAEAAASACSFCARRDLDSAILAESIFVVLISIIIIVLANFGIVQP